jgi:outer membrane protein assembly factor BamA
MVNRILQYLTMCAAFFSLLFHVNSFAQNSGSAAQGNIYLEYILDDTPVPWPQSLEDYILQLAPEQRAIMVPAFVVKKFDTTKIKYEEAKVGNDLFIRISARRVVRVSRIILDGTGLLNQYSLRKGFLLSSGSPWSLASMHSDAFQLGETLNKSGYFNSKLLSATVRYTSSGRYEVKISVDRGQPCRLGEVEMVPKTSKLQVTLPPLELGTICNQDEMKEKMESENLRQKKLGYLDAKVSLQKLEYSAVDNLAKATIFYELGKKTKTEFLNLSSGAVSEFPIPETLVYSSEFGDELVIEEATSHFKREFLKKGNVFASVEHTQTYETANERVYRFSFNAGEKYYIGKLKFTGDNVFDNESLVKSMELTDSFFYGKTIFVEEELDRKLILLKNFYISNGYLDVSVTFIDKKINHITKLVDLEFEVVLGQLHLFEGFRFLGLPSDVNVSEWAGSVKKGDPVTLEMLQNFESKTQFELLSGGYASAKVVSRIEFKEMESSQEGSPKKKIFLVFECDPGPKVRIGEVFGEGEFFGKREGVLSESGLSNGDLYTPQKMESARLRILKHDLFSNVNVEPYNSEELKNRSEIVDVVVRTVPKSGHTLGLQPGYGTVKGYRFAIDASKNNLTDTGTKVTGSIIISQEKQQFSYGNREQILGRKITFGIIEPLVKIGKVSTPVDLTFLSGLELTAKPFANKFFETLEVGASWRPYFFDFPWVFYNKMQHEWSKIVSKRFEPLQTFEQLQMKINEVVFGLQIDRRNSVDWPTTGTFWEFSSSHARYPLFSDVEFDRYSAEFVFFNEFNRLFSNAFAINTTIIENIGSKKSRTATVPSSRRVSLSGKTLVRGYNETYPGTGPLVFLGYTPNAGIDPRSCKPAIRSVGATNLIHFREEIRYRTSLFSGLLGYAWFTDAGTAFFRRQEMKKIEASIKQDTFESQSESNSDCILSRADFIADEELKQKKKSQLDYFYKSLYVSTGIGVRVILPSLTTINLDWGIPIREPADFQSGCPDSDETAEEIGTNQKKITCLKRKSSFGPKGVLRFPGSFHIGVGATF